MYQREVSVPLKKKIAFICVHNSCRSQIAEALGRHLMGEKYDFYSAGTETKPQINQDAVRLMKELYAIDMEQKQYSKTYDHIPSPDIVLMVGDRRDDVVGAARCDMRCVGVEWGFGTKEELVAAGAADVVQKPQELLKFF